MFNTLDNPPTVLEPAQRQHKFRILLNVQQKRLTTTQAAQLLATNEHNVRQMLTLYGKKLIVITPLIDMLCSPLATESDQVAVKEELAAILDITTRQVNRQLQRAGIEIPKPLAEVERVITHMKAVHARKTKRSHALSVISGATNVVDAAEDAAVSGRQMYRIIGKLLNLEHLTTRDLQKMKVETRRELADRLDIATKDRENEYV